MQVGHHMSWANKCRRNISQILGMVEIERAKYFGKNIANPFEHISTEKPVLPIWRLHARSEEEEGGDEA